VSFGDVTLWVFHRSGPLLWFSPHFFLVLVFSRRFSCMMFHFFTVVFALSLFSVLFLPLLLFFEFPEGFFDSSPFFSCC